MAVPQFAELPRKTRRRLVARALWDVAWINLLLFTIYAILPLRDIGGLGTLVLFIGGLALFAGAVTRQLTSIVGSEYPRLRAIVGIGTAIPLLIVVFSAAYVAMSVHHPSTFTEPLNKVGGIYFTITILATVGFGDITPKSDVARIIVTLQMVLDLTLVGVVVRAIGGAVTRGELAASGGATAGGEPTADPDDD